MIITNLQVNNVDGDMQFLASMHQLFYDGIETSFLINFDLIHLLQEEREREREREGEMVPRM
jgi:hypothetical protein